MSFLTKIPLQLSVILNKHKPYYRSILNVFNGEEDICLHEINELPCVIKCLFNSCK